MLRVALGSVAMVAAIAVGSSTAGAQDDRPSDGVLVGVGLLLAPPTYMVNVAAHEGSHAIAAILSGARVAELRLLPGRYGSANRFYFGYTRVLGLRTKRQRTLFWLAPKMTDVAMLSAYAALVFAGGLPDDRFGRLAVTVLATGFWVDFSKDIVAFGRGNDMVKIYRTNGFESELSRLPLRLAHAALAAAAGYAVLRGYDEVFEDVESGAALSIPMWSGSF